MRRTAVLLACVLAGVAAPLLTPTAASADPGHQPGKQLPGVSSAPYHSPSLTHPLGRKLG